MNQPLPLKKHFFAALKFAVLVSFTTFLSPGKLFAQAPSLSYATPQTYTVGAAITPLTPASSNVAAAAYSSTPVVLANTMPAGGGDQFSSLTCMATGELNGEPALFVAGSGSSGPDILYVQGEGLYGALIPLPNGWGGINALVSDGQKNLYFTTSGTNSVWKVAIYSYATPVAIATGGTPYGLAIDSAGNVYYSDLVTGAISKIPAQGGPSIVIGNVSNPQCMTADAAGDVYVANTGSGTVTEIPAGGGPVVQLNLGVPDVIAIAADASGNLFVNDTIAIYEVPAGASSPVEIASGITFSLGVAVDAAGNVYFTDWINSLVEEISPVGGYYLSAPLPAGLSFSNTTGAISGTPATSSPATDYTVTAYNASGESVTATVNITVAVTINSLQIADNSITNAATVNYTAVFNAPVSGLTAGNFSLAPAGVISGETVGTPTSADGGTTWTVPINTGTGDGTIRMDMVNATGLSAAVSTTLPFRGQSYYTIDKTAPSPNSISYRSNNANFAFAKAGDVITLSIPYSKQVQTPVATIGGHAATLVNVSGNTWNATYTATSTDPDGYISFDITATDLAGNTVESTSADFSSYVTIDNTAPTATISPSWGPGAYSAGNNGTASVSYYLEYNDTNFGSSNLTAAGITLNQTSTATGTVGVTGSGTSYTVTISNITGLGTLGISLAGGYASDFAGNTDAGAGQSATFNVVSSDATLSNIAFSGGALSPAFSSGRLNYGAYVATGVSSITVTPTTNYPGATVTVNGLPASIPVNLGYGYTTIPIVVTAADGSTTMNYRLIVERPLSADNYLTTIHLTPATPLTPATGPGDVNYTATVSGSVSSVMVTPVAQDPNATITVNGTIVTSGSPSAPITLANGANTITTVVKAQNGSTRTVIITVTRHTSANNYLSTIYLTPSTPLTATTGPGDVNYTATVTSAVTSVKVTAVTQDPTATVTVNGSPVASGTASGAITLTTGANTITTVVKAQNGSVRTIIITVNQGPSSDAYLTTVYLNPHTPLTSIAGPGDVNYTASVANSISSVTVTAVTQDANASITVNTLPVASGVQSQTLQLAVGPNTITIVVTAQDGATKRTVIITATRAAPPAADAYQHVSVEKPTETPTLTDDGILVHQGVSPNGDGIDDYLVIDGILAYPDNKLSIMNRNGQLIYETKGYDNSSRVFDGHSNKNGQMQLPGTYFYRLDYTVNGIAKHKTGFLVLKY